MIEKLYGDRRARSKSVSEYSSRCIDSRTDEVLISATGHAQTSVSEHGDHHSFRLAVGPGSTEAARRSLKVDAPPSAARIRLPGGAARKVSAPVRRADIRDTSAAPGPEPGTWKDPDPRRWRLHGACGLSRLNRFLRYGLRRTCRLVTGRSHRPRSHGRTRCPLRVA